MDILLFIQTKFHKMTAYKCIFSVLLIFTFYRLDARNEQYEYIFNKKDTVNVRLYGGLLHQHQDFFNKSFSYQGIEAGVVLNHKLLLGIFGGTFISNLNVNVAGYSLCMNIWKSGLVVGNIFRESKILHTGWLFNIGYFSLEHDNSNFELFNPQKSSAKINGLILMPELYAELNIAKWVKLRTGLGYSFYRFEDQAVIKSFTCRILV